MLLAAIAAPTADATVGKAQFRLNAASYYDQYSSNTAFLEAHISRVLGYPSFGYRYIGHTPAGVVCYHDAFTTWGPHSLNPTHRAEYVAWVQEDTAHGCGQFMDDIEWEGSGQNEVGTNAEILALIEAVRGALGPSGVLELNTQWVDLWPRLQAHNATVEAAMGFVNQVDKEFGVNKSSGINSQKAYAELLEYIDTLKAKGIHIDLADSEGPGDEYNLATYFLLNDGKDFIGSHTTPETWWAGWEVDLGEPLAEAPERIKLASGAYIRWFASSGFVEVNPPGNAAIKTPNLCCWKSATWGSKLGQVTLKERQGAVMLRE